MIVTRAAENTVWFASCNACLPHQNSRSLIVAPDGRFHARTELKREEVLVADIDVDQATRPCSGWRNRGWRRAPSRTARNCCSPTP